MTMLLIRMRAILLGLAALFAVIAAPMQPAVAQDALKIVAVVNEDIITELDLFMRMRLAMISAKLNDTPETRQRLLPTLLRTMIDERLKTQEAKRQNVSVAAGEVQQRIDDLAKRNGLTTDQFAQTLQNNGILIDIMADQIKTELAWARLVQRRLRSQVKITDEEIDQALANMQAAQGQTEYRLSQIYLSSGSGDEASVQQSAQRLKEQLEQGADFAALASEFSQDQGAIRGGDWGWVRLDMLDPPVASVVQSLQPGQIGGPVRGAGGYYVVTVKATRIIDVRSVSAGTVEMEQILWSLPSNAAESEVRKAFSQANPLISRVQSCADLANIAGDAKPGVYRNLGNVLVKDLPEEVQPYALNQPIGEPTPPLRTNRGVGLYVVCGRSAGDDASLSRVSVADRLGRQRLDTLARGYLSDLRRAAVIDIRL
ncbi:MAG: peptidylprolyl isomerase [Proteobacteria bacterium]|nr:peptidylprolyl isomerase [Pseudomonadota bacterium]